MGYKQPNNPMKMMKSALKMYKADKKAGMHRDSAMYMNSPMYKGHSPMEMGHESPAEMGHSPMEMGHDSPAKNASQYGIQGVDELKYMPIVDDMHRKGDSPAKNMDHSKMDKKQRFDHMMVHHPAKKPDFNKKGPEDREKPGRPQPKGSPAKAAKPDFPDIDGDGNTSESMKQAAADKKKGSPAKDMNKGYGQEVKSPMKMGHKDSPAKKYDRVVLGGNKGDKSKTKPGKKDYEGKGSPAKISEKAAERKAKKGKGFISQKTGGKDTEKSFTKLTRKGRKQMKETGMVSSKEMKKTKKIK